MADKADAWKWRAMAASAHELAGWSVCARQPDVVRELRELAAACEGRARRAEEPQLAAGCDTWVIH